MKRILCCLVFLFGYSVLSAQVPDSMLDQKLRESHAKNESTLNARMQELKSNLEGVKQDAKQKELEAFMKEHEGMMAKTKAKESTRMILSILGILSILAVLIIARKKYSSAKEKES